MHAEAKCRHVEPRRNKIRLIRVLLTSKRYIVRIECQSVIEKSFVTSKTFCFDNITFVR